MRPLLGLVIVLAAIGVAMAGWLLVSHPRGLRRGPIVLISIDTLRADHLPVYGYRGVKTPAIDALAADGVVFDRAYAHAPQTLPSHTSMMTGELPFEHGVRDNVGFTVKPGQMLLAGMLHAAGYQTAGFVSSFILRKATGIAQGFDVYDADMPPMAPNETFATVRRDGGQTMNRVEQWLGSERSARFFLFVHFYEPHRPYRPPERYAHYPSAYDGTIAYVDELVGRLITDLKARGWYDDATIALTSDHGEGLGDHGEQEHGVFLYDSTLRVAFIVKLPGGRDAGKHVTGPAEHIDLVPTLLQVARASAPRDLRGRSLLAAMDGSDPSLADRGIYSETLYPLYHFGWSPLYALTDARYRFIRAPKPELYDLEHDGGELHNLQMERPQTASSMLAGLDRLAGGLRIDQPSAVSGADLERFQALGYIGSSRTPASAAQGNLPDPKDKTVVLAAYRRGVDLRAEGRLPESAAAFRQVLADNPSMVDVWVQLGAVLAQQGDLAGSAVALKRAAQLDPALADNQVTLASTEFTLGRLDEAAEHARQAIAGKPGVAHELLSRIALARGDEQQALTEARLAEQGDPSLAYPLYVQGMALAQAGAHEQALSFFQRALAALDSHHLTMQGVHAAAGDALAHLGRSDEAEAQFRQELALFPQNSGARVALATLWRAEGRIEEANQMLTDALRPPATAANYAIVARTFQVFGEAAQARQVIARGLQQFPDSPELRAVGTAGRRH